MTPVLLRLEARQYPMYMSRDIYERGRLPSVQLNDDLAIAVVVYFLELANVACAVMISRCCEELNMLPQP